MMRKSPNAGVLWRRLAETSCVSLTKNKIRGSDSLVPMHVNVLHVSIISLE